VFFCETEAFCFFNDDRNKRTPAIKSARKSNCRIFYILVYRSRKCLSKIYLFLISNQRINQISCFHEVYRINWKDGTSEKNIVLSIYFIDWKYTARYKVQDRYIALRWLRFASILTLWNGFCITIGKATWNPSARLILKNVRHWSKKETEKDCTSVLSYKKGWTIEFFICPHGAMREWALPFLERIPLLSRHSIYCLLIFYFSLQSTSFMNPLC